MAQTVSRESTVESREFTLNICHLYPDLMDTYGDRGNILAITKRCHDRGINVTVSLISVGDNLEPKIHDLYFFGGGQDQAQTIVGIDLQKKKSQLIRDIENSAVMLSVCGGYQLLQKYFKTKDGNKIGGIGLFDAYTEASDIRMMNNLLIEIDPELSSEIEISYQKPETSSKLIGFENHSGKTFLGKSIKPLGTVISGNGNNGENKTEGAVYENAFGCYLHGSLLPKNPHFADFLISKALERKYGKVELKPLDDSIEWNAHNSAIKRIS